MKAKLEMILQNLKNEISALEKYQVTLTYKSILIQADYTYFGLIDSKKIEPILIEWTKFINLAQESSHFIQEFLSNYKNINQKVYDDKK